MRKSDEFKNPGMLLSLIINFVNGMRANSEVPHTATIESTWSNWLLTHKENSKELFTHNYINGKATE